MKKIKYLCTFLLLSMIMSSVSIGQVECVTVFTAELPDTPFAPAEIVVHAGDLIQNPDEYPNVECSINGAAFGPTLTFDCDDIGIIAQITVRPVGGSQADECNTLLKVEEYVGPTVVIEPEITLYLNGNSVVSISTDQVDQGTYDNCSVSSLELSQSQFSATGTYTVVMTATDPSGNQNQAFTTVTVLEGSSDPIACNNNINMSIGPEGIIPLEADWLLEGQATSEYGISVVVNGVVSPNGNILDCSMVGQQVQVQITDLNSGSSCWSQVVVEDKLGPIIDAQNVTVGLTDAYCPPSTENLTFIAENMIVVPGQSICVSILTRNFEAMQAGQGTFLWDPSVIRYTGLTNASLPGIDGSLNTTNTENGELKFVWTNPNPATGIDLPDDSAIFDLCFDGIGIVNESTALQLSTEGSLGFEWFDEGLDDAVPMALIDGTIAVGGTNNGLSPVVVPAGLVTSTLFDNCGFSSVNVSPAAFAQAGVYNVTITAIDIAGNSTSAQSTVTVVDQTTSTLDCVGSTVIESSPWGPSILLAETLVNNPDEFTTLTISRTLDGPYSEELELDCSEASTNPLTIYVKGTTEENSYICCTEVSFNDNVPPVPVVNPNVTVVLVSGVGTLTAEAVDDGSYDACSDIEISISQTQFTSADLGTNTVYFTATDASGNWNQAFTTVTVIEGANPDCTLENVTFPGNISINDPDAIDAVLSIENLQTQFGFSLDEVYPTLPAGCDNFAVTFSDQVINVGLGAKVYRTFTVLDWLTGDLISGVQLIRVNIPNQDLLCLENVEVNVAGGMVTVVLEDVLEGTDYDFSILTLEITTMSGGILMGNNISPNHIGETLNYTVTDITNGNTCFGEITVTDNPNGCTITEDDIEWPLSVIDAWLGSTDPADYTPDLLISEFGFSPSDVRPNVTSDCAIAGLAYEDEILESSSAYQVFIFRKWTVVDWLGATAGTDDGIYEFTQVIKGGLDGSLFICDELPNTAPVGDCESRHTLEDDVEWPADLIVADYRLSPAELMEFSGVLPKDAEPIFYNDPTRYDATYVDLLVDLSPTTITLSRLWTVEHNVNGLTWNYTQPILVDITNFANLVTVSTTSNRKMQGVMINSQFVTNNEGATELGDDVSSISFDDDVYNGLNIRDIIMMSRHILGIESLTPEQETIADVNEDGIITAADIVLLRKLIFGIEDQYLWHFEDINALLDSPVKPRATYIAYKRGDVDDNAIVNDSESEVVTNIFEVQDLLLNNGESYTVPVVLADDFDILGFDLRFMIDEELIKIDEVTTPTSLGNAVDHHVNEGRFFAHATDSEIPYSTDDSDGLLINITFTALTNGLLNDAINLDAFNSYLVDAQQNLIVVGGELDGMIGTGVNSEELVSVTAYPNPTVDYLHVDLSKVEVLGTPTLNVYGLNGQQLLSQEGSMIHVSNLPTGQYYYQVEIGKYQTVGKFVVTK